MCPAVMADTSVSNIADKVVELHMTKIVRIDDDSTTKKETPKKKPEYAKPHDDVYYNTDAKTETHHYICSGEFVDDQGDILTAGHCQDGMDSIVVVTHDQQEYEAVVVASSTVHDIALIHIDRQNTPFFVEASSEPTEGETCFTYGSPLGQTGSLSKGIIGNMGGDYTIVDMSVLPGNSGGPLFDIAGNLIGVTTAVAIVGLGVTHMGLAQSLDTVHFFLKKYLKK